MGIGLGWTGVSALAQDAAVVAPWVSTDSTLSLLIAPRASTPRHLDISMADRNYLQLLGFQLRGAELRAHPAVEPQAIEASGGPVYAKAYSLLGNGSAAGSLRYKQPKDEILLRQWSSDEESAMSEVESAPRPIFQFKLGSWQIPVLLSSAASR
jgi:hypothetical protein